jgi:Asp-tRNA(Asn)/Glu-tRNA(Gln) amidotransferase A subunit family amidase
VVSRGRGRAANTGSHTCGNGHFPSISLPPNTDNLLGWPVAVVRCAASPEGLPIGLQIVARPWREDVALAIARFVEHTFRGWREPGL